MYPPKNYNKRNQQLSFDGIDEQFHKAVETDRRKEYYKRKEEYLKVKEHYEEAKKSMPDSSLSEKKIEENYWRVLAPHGWQIRKEPVMECRLACLECYEVFYTIQGSTLREDSMWDVARKGVSKVKQHKCKAIPEEQEDE